MRAKLLLIDDHPLFAQGFAMMVRQARPAWTVVFAHDAVAGLDRLASEADIDLVIVDLQLPDLDGFETLRRVADLRPAIPRLVLSGREDKLAQMRAHQAGAGAFVIKTSAPDEILGQLDLLLGGDAPLGEATAKQSMPTLTVRQAEVLAMLADGCANKEIRCRLNIAERTVRAHLTELFLSLGVKSRVQALLQARKLGLLD